MSFKVQDGKVDLEDDGSDDEEEYESGSGSEDGSSGSGSDRYDHKILFQYLK
jgi:hypothetical protein